jgi:formylglycine-generating enzyme required for sulfatase activity
VPETPLHSTRIVTEPAGARLALAPIDEETGLPDARRVIRPAGKTPLVVPLEPGNYLVVADIPGYGFNEVYRKVPQGKDETPDIYRASSWHKTGDGIIKLMIVEIPRESQAIAGLVRLQGGAFVMGDHRWPAMDPHDCDVADFFLAPTEVTVGEFRQVFPDLTGAFVESGLPVNDDLPMTFVSFRDALEYAERVGLRLPTEAEYEFAATGGGTRKFPWEDDDQQIDDWQYGAVGSIAYDRMAVDPPVFGLYSNVAEWTDSRPIPYPSPLAAAVPNPFKNLFLQARVVRGGPHSVVQGAPNEEEWRRGPRWRYGENPIVSYRGLGFRCARSAKPRFLDQD